MIANIKLFFAAAALALLAACSSDTSTNTVSTTKNAEIGSPAEPLQMAVDAYTPPASAAGTKADSMVARSMLTQVAPKVIDLGAPAAAMSNNASNDGMPGKPLQISFGRDVAQTMNAAAMQQMLNWTTTPSGSQIAAISITSATAKSLRVGLLVTALPEEAKLRFYAKNAQTAHEISAKEILNLVSQNIAAGDKSDAARTFWSPITTGAEATVEIEIPPGVNTNSVVIAIPQISHFFTSLAEAAEIIDQPAAAAGVSCQVDVSCSASTPASNSVSLLSYMKSGSGYTCTGTLLNNSALDATPYIYTANHCISDQTSASSLVSYWFYKSASCNSASINFQTVYGGAALKYTAINTDTTLLQMNAPAPAGALFSGWDASMQSMGNTFTGIHHPKADPQRKSSGSVSGFFGDIVFSGRNFTVQPSTQLKSTFYEMTFNQGVVEPGSSGSAIFKNISTNPQVVGVLTGGYPATCTSSTTSSPQINYYGRFDYAYAAGMSAWLSPGRKAVYRFYNTTVGSHFFTRSGVERNNIISTLPNYSYEGVSFYVYSAQSAAPGLVPVFRFYNTKTGAHFFTNNVNERNNVIATLPQYNYEGTAWFAQTANVSGTTPLYRFYHKGNGTHFYTISKTERDSIISRLPIYSYEGVAYYVWTSQ